MSLTRLVEFLIKGEEDGSVYRYHRAITLFEFQVSLFYQGSFKRLIAANGDAIAPTTKLRRARALATMKILQHLEEDIKTRSGTFKISIRELAQQASYRDVFDDLFLANGSWDQIVSSISQSGFDKEIRERCKLAKTAADIIDFSYRFARNEPKIDFRQRRNPGGLDAAR
jgi:hypothetical protein